MTLQAKLDAVKRDPNNADLWVELAEYLKKNDMMAQARSSYERALQIDPTREELYEQLWQLETHDALPAWFNELDQSANAQTHETPVKKEAKKQAKKQVNQQNNRSAGFIVLAILASLSACVLAGLVLLLFASDSSTAEEGNLPDATRVALAQDGAGSQGQTLEEAVPLGKSLLLKEGFEITVQKLFLEKSDNFEIRYYYKGEGDDEKEWYDNPPPNMRPYVIRLKVENITSENDYLHFPSDMAVHDQDSITHDHDCGITPEELGGAGASSLPIGERTEGNICFLIPEDAQIGYLIYDDYEERRYFKLAAD